MWWRLGWLAAFVLLACASPAVAPLPPSPTPAAFVSNAQEPWRLTATAEVVQAPTLAALAHSTSATHTNAIAERVESARAYERAGDYGLAVEEMRQAVALAPGDRAIQQAAATMQRQATQAVPTQRVLATLAAVDMEYAAQ